MYWKWLASLCIHCCIGNNQIITVLSRHFISVQKRMAQEALYHLALILCK